MRTNPYVSALRLRTLPLSLSGVTLGAMLAASDYLVDWKIFAFVALTAILLQMLSNVSNELGDFRNGVTSAHDRESSKSLAEGRLTEKGLKRLMYVVMAAAVASGLVMIRLSLGSIFLLESFILMIFGYFSIRAAMRYTLGTNPYGYRGLGDIAVFIFFGIIAVCGSFYVLTHSFGTLKLLLPAASVGFFSVAVLNVNNMRDMETDMKIRRTLPVVLGERRAKVYHMILLALGWISMTAYALMRIADPWHFLYMLTLPLFIIHAVKVWKNSGRDLDPALPLLSLSALAFSVLAGLGFLIYLF